MKNISLVKIIAALMICNVFLFCCISTGTIGGAQGTEQPQIDKTESDVTHTIGGTVDFIGEDNVVEETNKTESETTSFSEIEKLGFAKPTLAQKSVKSSYFPTSSVKNLTEKAQSTSKTSSSSKKVPDIVDSYVAPDPVSEPEPEPEPEPKPESNYEPNPEPTSENGADFVSYPDEDNSDDSPESPTESENTSSSDNSSANNSDAPSDNTSDDDTPAPVPDDDEPSAEILRVNNDGTEVSGKAVDIVSQIVENEIGFAFAPEAIKAQAVAAYTYVKYHNLHGSAPYCILKEDVHDSIKVLVESVLGEAVYYDGEIIQAVYSASSAGSTASSKNVWGGDIPYLQGVVCELDEKYDPNYGIKTTFSKDDIMSRIFDTTGISLLGDPSEWFEIVDRTEGKYVGNMKIGGKEYFVDKDGDTLQITGRRFREIIMEFDLRSAAFDIEYDSDAEEFTITTYGYGHGVGLSQNGANALATYWGWDYKKILTFYYQGTEVY